MKRANFLRSLIAAPAALIAASCIKQNAPMLLEPADGELVLGESVWADVTDEYEITATSTGWITSL